jgi:hypothetical protein
MMAHEYTSWAYKQDLDQPGAKFVLVALADSANADGYAFPGQKRLGSMTSMGERTVRRHLAFLEERGYIRRVERRRNDGSRTSDAYFLPRLDSTGQIGRWDTTGQIGRTPRPDSTSSPARLAGHEPSVEPPVEPSPPTPPPAADPQTEIEDDDFDPQALKRLQKTDRELHKRIETRAGSLGWQFRHKVLLAMRALADPDRTLAALQATIEGADGKGAKAWRYFAACYENHGQQKPSAEGDIDDLLRRYMHAEGVIDGERFTVIAAAPDGKTLVTDGAGYLTPDQVEEGMACLRN